MCMLCVHRERGCVCVRTYVCVCVCVSERERERDERESGVCLCCAFLQFSTVFSSLLSCRKKCFVLFYPTFSLNLTALTPLYYVRRQCYEKIVKLHDGNIGNFGNIGFFSYFTMFQKSLKFFWLYFSVINCRKIIKRLF